MPQKTRDDFSRKTRNALALRANYRCSFTGCQCATTGPSDEAPDAAVNVGVAAHICAAAPGGARYNGAMTAEQRSHITNAVWMCSHHASLIDRDEARYSADVLRRMKHAHEADIQAQLEGRAGNNAITDLVAFGMNLVVRGELIGSSGNAWTLEFDHFVIGDESELIRWCESAKESDAEGNFVLINSLGEGRCILGTPAWRRHLGRYQVTCQVRDVDPRADVRDLPMDLALGNGHDLHASSQGSIATVAGLDALPQKIKICLSTAKGTLLFHRGFGSRIAEYFAELRDSPWLPRLLQLEVIRMACIPYVDESLGRAYTPLQCVRRVLTVVALPEGREGPWLPFQFALDVEGIGHWQCETELLIPPPKFVDGTEPLAPPRSLLRRGP